MKELSNFISPRNKVYLMNAQTSMIFILILRRLTTVGHANPRTIAEDRAAAAKRGNRLAEVLAEGDQKIVPLDPVTGREDASQGLLRLLRRLRCHKGEPVRDPVDVGIDADARFAKSEGHHQIRRLAADALEG